VRIAHLLALGLTLALAVSACAKSSNSSTASQSSGAPASAAPVAAGSSEASATVKSPGMTVYVTNCASCHQANGKGLTGSFPPLAGNPTVTGDPKKVIHIVKYGLTGKVMVGPDSFNGIMPPWGSQLSDAAIANVVTYVRSSWGNKASAVDASEVGAVNK
jgi:mono/diheme cytochrome c family protein